MSTKTFTLRLKESLYSKLSVMADQAGLNISTMIRVIINEAVEEYQTNGAKAIRSRILSGGEDYTQPKPEKRVEGLSSSPEAPSKQDWDALSFDARRPIVQAYRNKMRGNPYDAHLEPYFTFVENA